MTRRPSARLLPLPLLFALAACGADPAPAEPVATPAAPVAATPPAQPPPVQLGDPGAQQMTQMARLGGGLHASTELCGIVADPAELARMTRQQREAATARDVISGAQFDAAFAEGEAEARGAFARAGADERERACGDLRKLHEAAPAG